MAGAEMEVMELTGHCQQKSSYQTMVTASIKMDEKILSNQGKSLLQR